MHTFMNSLKDSSEIRSYIRTFNETDVGVRQSNVYEEYAEPFTMYEKIYLRSLLIQINFIIYSYNFLYSIPWVFAKSKKGVENNFAHTQKNIIVLPYNFMTNSRKSLIKTIIHEKVHIYQKYNMISTVSLFMNYWGLLLYDYKKHENQRANPDINHMNFTYYDPLVNSYVTLHTQYTNNAKSLYDSVLTKRQVKHSSNEKSLIYYSLLQNNSYQKEHPNELMACLIADMIVDHKKHTPTENWMKNV